MEAVLSSGHRITVTARRGGFYTWIWTDEVLGTVDSPESHWPRRSEQACVDAALRKVRARRKRAARDRTFTVSADDTPGV